MTSPDVSAPVHLPDLRVWLADQWKPGHPFATATVAWHEGDTATAGAYSRHQRALLEHATLWWVAEDMVDLLLASVANVPDDVRLDDLPVMPPAGLVVFEKPWWGVDAEQPERRVQVNALLWGSSLLQGLPDSGHPEPRVCMSVSTYTDMAVVPARKMWLMLGRSDWPVDDQIGSAPWTMSGQALASVVEDRKVLAALWSLLHQRGIAATTTERPQRQAVRRTQRAGISPELADVQVVTLRKLERTEHAPNDERAAVEWSHRWLVAGHWRWQPYGPERALRRLTYVRPHVKGPADKPLHLPERVNAWVR